MAPRYLTQSDLESRVGSARVLQLFDEDHDGVLGAGELAILAVVLEAAEGEVDSLMLRSHALDAIATMADADQAFKLHASWIALEFAAERRSEYLAPGGIGPYKEQYDRAIKFFDKLSKGRHRSAGETEAGVGASVGGTLQPTLPSGSSRFVFSPDNDNPTGHGGF